MVKLFFIFIFVISSNLWAQGPQSSAELGELLFFDTRLSGSNTFSCASCHQPDYQWTEPLAIGRGHLGEKLSRRTPTILNSAFSQVFFWDGRASSLEEQALMPIKNQREMGQDLRELLTELAEVELYQEAFDRIYPGPSGGGLRLANIAKALADFQRQQIVGFTDYERWLAGDDRAINHPAQMGFRMFQSERFKCATCHKIGDRHPAGDGRFITSFTDSQFWDVGLPVDKDSPDLGRWDQLSEEEQQAPENITQKFAFKTPTLWNVACRAPYMHDGSLATLEEVLDHYAKGGELIDENGIAYFRPSLSPHIKGLSLNRMQKHHIVEFLKTLSDDECKESL